eukprot:7525484-Alexandrium_andersonii.AAC.1
MSRTHLGRPRAAGTLSCGASTAVVDCHGQSTATATRRPACTARCTLAALPLDLCSVMPGD